MRQDIIESASYLKERIKGNPEIAIVLGTGLGELAEKVEIITEIPYETIPHFPVSQVQGHKGTLIHGRLNGVELIIMNGRCHYYEGHTQKHITFPIPVLKQIGVKKLILSNAAGGANPSFKIGDVMLIRDHINLMGSNPLLGPNDDAVGVRFPSMNNAYSAEMLKLAAEIAQKNDIHLQSGVYLAMEGPYFGSAAECRMYYIMGCDAIGMSTVPETIAAVHCGLEVFALSVITDLAIVGEQDSVSHEEVLGAAAKAGPKVAKLIYEMLPQL
ncbi:MAG: purine-nucleoside phosphorylase [Bacteroidales bacterium]|nr:purine-nucleoside phosphorylase [Bacteroidales bacterium]MBQ7489441.1 purine-nucleoside phosphorylase [Bacteroidales bacterium]